MNWFKTNKNEKVVNDKIVDEYYQVFCDVGNRCSGGLTLADETRYATVEEARGAAEALAGEHSDHVYSTHRVRERADGTRDAVHVHPNFADQTVDQLGDVHFPDYIGDGIHPYFLHGPGKDELKGKMEIGDGQVFNKMIDDLRKEIDSLKDRLQRATAALQRYGHPGV